MRLSLARLAAASLLLVCACAKRDPVAAQAKAVNLPLPANHSTPDPAGLPPDRHSPGESAAPAPDPTIAIPADLQGRWGLTPADCIAKSDQKGLLIVTSTMLRFYESRATPSANVQSLAGTIDGDFDFVGEGEHWARYEALKRSGDKLTRTETNPAASYTYAKC